MNNNSNMIKSIKRALLHMDMESVLDRKGKR